MGGGAPSNTRCPNCQAVLPVSAEWRLVQCPQCGHTIARMDDDPTFD